MRESSIVQHQSELHCLVSLLSREKIHFFPVIKYYTDVFSGAPLFAPLSAESSPTCSMLYVRNIFFPKWLPIDCNNTLNVDIVCTNFKMQEFEANTKVNLHTAIFCPFEELVDRDNDMCYNSSTPEKQIDIYHTQYSAQLQSFSCNGSLFFHSVLIKNDGTKDCEFGDDEDFICFTDKEKYTASYCSFCCVGSACMCSDLFLKGPNGGCIPLAEHAVFSSGNRTEHNEIPIESYFTQMQRKLLALDSQSTVYSDCTPTELSHFEAMANIFENHCRPNKHQCTKGCTRCYSAKKKCIFELDIQSRIMHCPSGAHLKDCDFSECYNYFACSLFYCIPYR